mmetsp:Transcript_18100/g.15087  ORF Transcript_18100/g.15087 Transcript_18100/m.15087 type:complete len:143 (+) Transcript_18100:2-430(+)
MEWGVKQHDRLCSFGKLTVPRSQLTARRHFLASGTLAPQPTTSIGAASPMSATGSDGNVTIGVTPKCSDPPAPLQLPGAAMSSASPVCSPVGRSITIMSVVRITMIEGEEQQQKDYWKTISLPYQGNEYISHVQALSVLQRY